ncbi:hypothetical protein BACI349Y_410029 [Bacillus sp. 349Y]|nr:hypothetical protein BACI349Y_410029 [Bacillus sp. 349Y]
MKTGRASCAFLGFLAYDLEPQAPGAGHEGKAEGARPEATSIRHENRKGVLCLLGFHGL